MLKRLIYSFLLIIIVLGALAIQGYRLLNKPLNLPNNRTVIVTKGSNLTKLSTELFQDQILSHPKIFLLTAKLTGKASQLRPGEYLVEKNMTSLDLLDKFVSGDVIKRRIQFIEGWKFSDIQSTLTKNNYLQHDLTGKTNQQIMQLLNDSHPSPEGLFFPDTYRFLRNDTDLSILKRSHAKMQKILTSEWQNRAPNLLYKNPYQALIAASLIEKESAIKAERPMIAEVILNRLQKNMRLQIDPTVNYAIHKPFAYLINRQDMKSHSPYNTYRVKGLPPTPIDMPSRSSIHAALHPTDLGNLYYVSKNDGTHDFSKTYSEHREAVDEYQK